jgi:hypothetical protein
MKYRILLFLAISLVMFACEDEPVDPNYDLRDEYVGDWLCSENSSIYGNSSYTISIEKSDTNEAFVIISNFYNLGSSISLAAEVFDNSILIPQQNVGGNIIDGTGTSTANYSEFNLTYSVNDGADNDVCTATCTPL